MENETLVVGAKISCMLAGAGLIITGIWKLVEDSNIASKVILSVYCLCFSLMFVAAEFRIDAITDHFSFMKTYMGRGIFYCFVGTLAIGLDTVGIVCGVFTFCVGLLHIFLSFKGVGADDSSYNPPGATSTPSGGYGGSVGGYSPVYGDTSGSGYGNSGPPPPATA